MLFRTNAQSEAYEQALADAGIPYLLRGGERFFEREEVREAVLLLRGAARRRRRQQAARRARARRPRRRGLERAGRRPAAARSASAGSRCPRSWRWPTTWSRRAPAPGCPTSSPSWTSARPPSTRRPSQGVTLASLHAAKGLEWDAVFLVGLQRRAWCRSACADDPRAGRGGAPAALRRRSPAPASTCACPGRGSRNPGGRGSRRPRASSTVRPVLGGPAPPAGRPAAGRRRQAGAGRLPARAGSAGPISPRRRPQGRPLRRLPAHLRRGDVRGAAQWRRDRRERDQGAGVRRVHRRHADRDRRAHSRPTSRLLARSRASGPPSSSGTASRCWRSWAEPTRSRSPKTLLLQPNPRRLTRPDGQVVKVLR